MSTTWTINGSGMLTCRRCGEKTNVLVGLDCWTCSRLPPVPIRLHTVATPIEKALHELDPEALRENGESWARRGILPVDPERLVPIAEAYAMVERLFQATYDLVDGRRVCRVCGSGQYERPGGHFAGCDVAAAIADVLRR